MFVVAPSAQSMMHSTRSTKTTGRGTKRRNNAPTAMEKQKKPRQDRYTSRLPTAGAAAGAAGADKTAGVENRTPIRNSPVSGTEDRGGTKETPGSTPTQMAATETPTPAALGETPRSGGGDGNENAENGGSANNVSPEQDYKISQQEAGHMMSIGQVIGHLKTTMRTEVFPKIKFFRKGLYEDDNLIRNIILKKVGTYVENAGSDFKEVYPELRKAASHAIRTKRSTVVGGIQDVLMSKFSLRYFSARIEKCALTAVVSLLGKQISGRRNWKAQKRLITWTSAQMTNRAVACCCKQKSLIFCLKNWATSARVKPLQKSQNSLMWSSVSYSGLAVT